MKCELCHQADAACAIPREDGAEDDELYVCRECAKAERQKRKAKSQRTRKLSGLPPGVSMSVTEFSATSEDGDGDGPPPFLGAIMEAIGDIVGAGRSAASARASEKRGKKQAELTAEDAPAEFRIGKAFHLEGLHLIGELDAVKRALRALGMELSSISSDAVPDSGHAYTIKYGGSAERAKRVAGDILREEGNARARLRDEMSRVFGDSACRALAILKNCRLLSATELFDLLSPLRLAAIEKKVEGIGRREIERMMTGLDISASDENVPPEERDRVDAERADEMNRRFEEVMLDDVL